MTCTIQTLLNSSRLMIFENEMDVFDYAARGTVFLCYYKGALYGVTAAHVVKGFDADAIRVMIHPEEREFLPHDALVTLVPVDKNDPDYTDLAVFPIQQGMFDHTKFRDWPPFTLTEGLVKGDPPTNGRLIFRGFPGDRSGIDFDTCTIRQQPVILEGERTGRATMAHCHEIDLHDVSPCSTLDDFSGSPVFWISDDGPPKQHYFAGVLIRGSHSGRKAYYVDGEVLKQAFERL